MWSGRAEGGSRTKKAAAAMPTPSAKAVAIMSSVLWEMWEARRVTGMVVSRTGCVVVA